MEIKKESEKKYKFGLPIPVNEQLLVEKIDYADVDTGPAEIFLLQKKSGYAPDPTIGKVVAVAEIMSEKAGNIKVGDYVMINPFSDREIRVNGKWYGLVHAAIDVYAILPVDKINE
jgi:co-chaperonin GroES (HSP10)